MTHCYNNNNSKNAKKRVTLNRRPSSLLLDYQAMLKSTTDNEYTHQLVESALSSVKLEVDKASPIQLLPRHPAVLKSSLRSASAPSIAKSVSFHHQLEEICLFKKAQTPSAIAQRKIFWDTGSPFSSSEEDEIEPQRTLVCANWPTKLADMIDRRNKVIRVEKNYIQLDEDDEDFILGKVAVRNLSYHKSVTVRYTFDFWETVQNAQARFYSSLTSYDLFDFKIQMPPNATHLYFAVNYKVGSDDFWDNNNGRNYEIQIVTKQEKNSISANTNTNIMTKDVPHSTQKQQQKQHQQQKPQQTKTQNHQPPQKANTNINKNELLKSRYDFDQAKINTVSSAQNSLYYSSQLLIQKTLAIPIPSSPSLSPSLSPSSSSSTRCRSSSSPMSCNSPLASSPSFMDLNSQSYLDLVNKYCFYSTSPSRSPMSING